MAVAVPNLNLQLVQNTQQTVSQVETKETNGEKFEDVFSKVQEKTSEQDSQKNNKQSVKDNKPEKQENNLVEKEEKKIEESPIIIAQMQDSLLPDLSALQSEVNGLDEVIANTIADFEQTTNNISNEIQNDVMSVLQEVASEEVDVSAEVDKSFEVANEQFKQIAEVLKSKEVEENTKVEVENIEKIAVEEVKVENQVKPQENGVSLKESKFDKQDMFEQVEIETSADTETDSNATNQQSNENFAQDEDVKLTVDNDSNKSEFLSSDKNIIFNKIMDTMSTTNVEKSKAEIKTDVVKQIDEGVQELSLKNPKVNIVLRPENLGKVAVELQNGKDGLVAKFAVNSLEVKEIFDKSIDTLKNTLAAQGVNVDNIVIKMENTANADNNYLNFQNEQFNQNEHANPNKQNAYKQEVENNKENLDAENKEPVEEEEQPVENLNKTMGKVDYRV